MLCPENKVEAKYGIIAEHIKLILMTERRRLVPQFIMARISPRELSKNNDLLILAEVTHIFESAEVHFCTLY